MKSILLDSETFFRSNDEFVLIMVGKTLGSAPREKGTWMIVGNTSIIGTIGGGQLEFSAISKARYYINNKSLACNDLNFELGPETGQCCGGKVSLIFQRVNEKTCRDMLTLLKTNLAKGENVYIFGAGHVGIALTNQFLNLPVNIFLFDTRPEMSPKSTLSFNFKCTPFPEAEIRKALPGGAFIILTHDHSLDFLLVKEAIKRKDASYIGMIGSKTKRGVLGNWLKREGISSLRGVTTPIGLSGIKPTFRDKRPEVIAALVVTEVLTSFHNFNLLRS